MEAARRAIIAELTKTIKSHSLSVDRRHIALVADVITCRGNHLNLKIDRFIK